jgi:hypothetical protein
VRECLPGFNWDRYLAAMAKVTKLEDLLHLPVCVDAAPDGSTAKYEVVVNGNVVDGPKAPLAPEPAGEELVARAALKRADRVVRGSLRTGPRPAVRRGGAPAQGRGRAKTSAGGRGKPKPTVAVTAKVAGAKTTKA